MIPRKELEKQVKEALGRSPVVALLGPRQCGKTTLARQFLAPAHPNYFDLQDPRSVARLSEPMTALESLEGLVVLDEIQHQPELFRILRVLVDRIEPKTQFLVLGSAAPALLHQATESLAGRMAYIQLSGFDLSEVGSDSMSRLWLRGGMPRSFLAATEADWFSWQTDFMRSYIERDLPQAGVALAPPTILRFWTMPICTGKFSTEATLRVRSGSPSLRSAAGSIYSPTYTSSDCSSLGTPTPRSVKSRLQNSI